MPVVVDQHTIDIRITLLQIEIEELRAALPTAADDDSFKLMNDALTGLNGQLRECNLWMKILNQDPGYGDLINVGGKRMPKMPTFKDKAEMEQRVSQWESGGGAGDGLDLEQTMRARESNSRNMSQESVQFMDRLGPIAAKEFESEPE